MTIRDSNLSLEIVKYLLEQKADIEIKNNEGNTPLHVAVLNHRLEVIHYLVEQSTVNLNTPGNRGNTALHFAMTIRDAKFSLEIVKYLLEKKAILKVKNRDGHTPINLAIINRHYEIIQYLRKKNYKRNKSLEVVQIDPNPLAKDLESKTKISRQHHVEVKLENELPSKHRTVNINSAEGFNLLGFFKPISCPHNNLNDQKFKVDYLHMNNTLYLVDMLVRKKTGKKHNFFQDNYLSDLEVQAYALNIITEFEKDLKESEINADFNEVALLAKLVGKIKSGQLCEISKILLSTIQEANFPILKQVNQKK
jgi:ankyrin repeat protein